MINRSGIHALEERALNAWPARQSVFQNGWVFRLSGGYTKRANSANALTPQGDFSAVLAAAESLYARHSLPTVFRLTPLAPADADRALEEAGYEFLDATIVMTCEIGSDETDDQNVAISPVPTPQWCAGFAGAQQIAPEARGMHDSIVSKIAPPTAFATITDGGAPVGYAIAVTDNGMTGLFDIVVPAAKRGRGLGRRLTKALLGWGRSQGAAHAYLQVTVENTSAQALYRGLGFVDAYRYHYRRQK
jgi:ribosomal protein S18 acetylase RimI-like enzyme